MEPESSPPGTAPLSVCVITLNEADNIERCLRSVEWADEILVVDSGSDDPTVEIAGSMGARVLHNDWPGFIEQKQFATDRATHDWVLNVDADEIVDDELGGAVRSVLEDPPDESVCYEVTRKSRYLGTWITHGSWYPDRIVRLFNRRTAEWGGYDPHAHVEPAGEVRRLGGHLLHHPYENLSDHLEFINRYTTTMAEQKDRQGVRGSLSRAFGHAAFKGFKDLVLKQGFLDGRAGIVAAAMGTYYTFLKYVKLWEMQTLDHGDE